MIYEITNFAGSGGIVQLILPLRNVKRIITIDLHPVTQSPFLFSSLLLADQTRTKSIVLKKGYSANTGSQAMPLKIKDINLDVKDDNMYLYGYIYNETNFTITGNMTVYCEVKEE